MTTIHVEYVHSYVLYTDLGSITLVFALIVIKYKFWVIVFVIWELDVFVYVIVWLAVVLGINSVSNAGGKIVIVRGEAEHYYSFPACITRTINSKYYS